MIGLDELIHRLRHSIREQQAPVLQEAVSGGVTCRICGDTGIVCSGDVAWICECQRHNGKLRQQAGIAPELRDYSFEGFRVDYYDGQHRERALAALQGRPRIYPWTVFRKSRAGGSCSPGMWAPGKTFLAAAVTNELLNRGIRAQFLVVPDFLDDLRTALLHNTGDSREPDDVALLRRVRRGEVLILDDLGAHNYTEWTCNKLYSLLNYRLNYQLPVIITTNLKMSELDEYLGNAQRPGLRRCAVFTALLWIRISGISKIRRESGRRKRNSRAANVADRKRGRGPGRLRSRGGSGSRVSGTPSTEILENFVGYPGVYAEWAPNEKVALEGGLRSIPGWGAVS